MHPDSSLARRLLALEEFLSAGFSALNVRCSDAFRFIASLDDTTFFDALDTTCALSGSDG